MRAVNPGSPANFPKHFVAAEESQVNPGRAGCFYISAFISRTILVVSDGQQCLVLQNQGAETISIQRTEIGDIETVGLEETHHRIFGVEDPGIEFIDSGVVRAVVTDFVSPVLWARASRIQVRTA